MKAIVTVIGKDKTGIIAKTSAKLAEWNVNIEDISQTVLQDNFAMVMLVDIQAATVPFDSMSAELEKVLTPLGVTVHVQHEDVFNCMHKV